MPTQRGSSVLCDALDMVAQALESHGRSIIALVPREGLADLRSSYERLLEEFAPLPRAAAEQDDALMCIGAIAGAGRVSRHCASKVKQAAADAEQMAVRRGY